MVPEWHTPIILGTSEAKAEGLQVPDQSQQFRETLSQNKN